MANCNVITVGHTVEVGIVTYKGENVLTLSMIDEVHNRRSGAASDRFRENRERFIEGKHYHMVPYAEAEALKPYGVDVPTRGLILITKRGYLLLVKSFTDDLAWEVQEQLVDHYFEGQAQLLPITDSECISNKQYYALRDQIDRIADHYHMKESTSSRLANVLRFKLNVGGLKDIPADAYDKACAIIEGIKQQDDVIFDFRLDLEREIVDHLCEGIPFTGTIRKKIKEKFLMKLPHNPNWRDAVRQLEAPDDDGPKPLPQS